MISILLVFLFQDDFVDKNRKLIPYALNLMIKKSTTLFVIPDSDLKPERTKKSTASSLKYGIDCLIERLKETVSNNFK